MSEDLQVQSENVPSHDEQAASSPAPEAEAKTEVEAEASATETPEGEKKPNKVQERINQLTREKYEERQKRAELEARIKELESNKPKSEAPKLQAPKESDFDDYSQYESAREKFIAEQAANAAVERIKAEQNEAQERKTQAQRETELQAKRKAFEDNLTAKRESFQNFEEVAYGHEFMDVGLAEMIFDMDKGPEVAYHLGSHLDDAERIFSLSPIERARELTKLEFQVQELNPKKVSDAPDPISPLESGSESVDKDPDDMSADEWLAWRRKQLANR